VEVRADDGTLVVLDCGTGARELGRALKDEGASPVHGHLLIGHTHWDHIQGFPFFDPLSGAGNEWEVYAPGAPDRTFRSAIAKQMEYDFSPINLDGLHADIRFHDLNEGTLDLGSVRVSTQYLNHPTLTLAYRLEADGATLVYATDHEPLSLHPIGATPGTEPIHHEDRRHIRFLEGADLLIHDSQYTLDEFPRRAGWGHTPVERAVDYAMLARAKRLALFHHDPDRHDDEVDELLDMARGLAADGGAGPEVLAAAEGAVIELRGTPGRERTEAKPLVSALLSDTPPLAHTVLIVEDDPDMLLLTEAALRSEGVRVLTARDVKAAVELAHEHVLSLILLDLQLPGGHGLDVCRALRADPEPRLRDLPILILTGTKLKEADLVEGFRAGASDYLAKPIKPTLIRSRVRARLLRSAPV
jgi:CheY-like chemotaxis protein